MKIAAGILLCLIGVVSQAKGAAIDYTINFTASDGVAPTSGLFTYDENLATPFSNFKVVWRSFEFDFTNTANGNSAVGGQGCTTPSGRSEGSFNFDVLFSPTALPCGGPRGWQISESLGERQLTFFDNAGGGEPSPFPFRILSLKLSVTSLQPSFGMGTYTVTETTSPVPEPSTAIMTIGGAVLYLRSRVKGRRTKKQETSGK
jgi:hypothetical protein